MVTKHFLKTLVTFMVMIILGLVGVFLVSFFDNTNTSDSSGVDTDSTSNSIDAVSAF